MLSLLVRVSVRRAAKKVDHIPRSANLDADNEIVEDWKEAGRAVRDRSGDIAKETVKAGADALKAAKSVVNDSKEGHDENVAKDYPPESVNNYDVKQNVSELAGRVSAAGKKVAEKVKETLRGTYSKVESINKVGSSKETPADQPQAIPEDYEIKEKDTKEAFEKGKQLMQRESLNE